MDPSTDRSFAHPPPEPSPYLLNIISFFLMKRSAPLRPKGTPLQALPVIRRPTGSGRVEGGACILVSLNRDTNPPLDPHPGRFGPASCRRVGKDGPLFSASFFDLIFGADFY